MSAALTDRQREVLDFMVAVAADGPRALGLLRRWNEERPGRMTSRLPAGEVLGVTEGTGGGEMADAMRRVEQGPQSRPPRVLH